MIAYLIGLAVQVRVKQTIKVMTKRRVCFNIVTELSGAVSSKPNEMTMYGVWLYFIGRQCQYKINWLRMFWNQSMLFAKLVGPLSNSQQKGVCSKRCGNSSLIRPSPMLCVMRKAWLVTVHSRCYVITSSKGNIGIPSWDGNSMTHTHATRNYIQLQSHEWNG